MKPVATSMLITFVLAACSHAPERPPATLAELEKFTTAKSPHEMATYIFDNYGCKNCHTIASGGKFGYTEMGELLKSKSEGCVSLLTAVSKIATLPEADRTAEHKQKLARFTDYGCTACHRILFGSVGVTEIGARLQGIHLACTDVQRVLN